MWLTVKQVADKFKVDPKTVHRNWKAHKQFIKYRQFGNSPLEISAESLPVYKEIRRLYAQKLTKEKINEELANSYPQYISEEEEATVSEVRRRDTIGTSIMDNSFYDDMFQRFQELEEKNNKLLEMLLKKDEEAQRERGEFRKEREAYLERERRRDDDFRELTKSVIQMTEKLNNEDHEMNKEIHDIEHPKGEKEEVTPTNKYSLDELKEAPKESFRREPRSKKHKKGSFWSDVFSVLFKRK